MPLICGRQNYDAQKIQCQHCVVSSNSITALKFLNNPYCYRSYLLGVNARPDDRRITLYMGVPTMYSKLIEEYERVFKQDPKMAEYIRNTLKSKVKFYII